MRSFFVIWDSGGGQQLMQTGKGVAPEVRHARKRSKKPAHMFGFLCLQVISFPRSQALSAAEKNIFLSDFFQLSVPETAECLIRKMNSKCYHIIVQKIMAIFHACLIVVSLSDLC